MIRVFIHQTHENLSEERSISEHVYCTDGIKRMCFICNVNKMIGDFLKEVQKDYKQEHKK